MSWLELHFNTSHVSIELAGGVNVGNSGNANFFRIDWNSLGLPTGYIYVFDFKASGYKPLTQALYAFPSNQVMDITLERYDYSTDDNWWNNILKSLTDWLNPSKWVYALRSAFYRFQKGLDDINDWINSTGSDLKNWIDNNGKVITDWISDTGDKIDNWISTTGADINDWVQNTGKNLNKWYVSVKDDIEKLKDIPALVLSSLSHIFLYLASKFGSNIYEMTKKELSNDDIQDIDNFINELNDIDEEVIA